MAWIRRFILFHNMRHPAAMGAADVGRFLSSLAENRHVSASTQKQAFAALLFLYRHVRNAPLSNLEHVVRAKRPQHLPVVLTRTEVAQILGRLNGLVRLMAWLMYGSGLHLLEDGYDIRTIQELLGHRDVATTMICTHLLNRGLMGVRSPADRL